MWIMVAGPYRAGSSDPIVHAANLRELNLAAVALFRMGHVPIIGVNAALPMIEAAGGTDTAYDELMMPVSSALTDRCDACLRLGGPSNGADEEVDRFRTMGKPVFRAVADVPVIATALNQGGKPT